MNNIFLNNMSIKSRLILEMVLSVMIFIVFSSITLNQISNINYYNKLLYNGEYSVLSHLNDAETQVYAVSEIMLNSLILSDNVSVETSMKNIQSCEEFFYQSIDKVKEITSDQSYINFTDNIIKYFSEWRNIRDEIFSVLLSEHSKLSESNLTKILTKEKNAIEKINSEIKMFKNKINKNAQNYYNLSKESEESGIYNTRISFIISAIILIIFTFIFIKSILNLLKTLKKDMEEITLSGVLKESLLEGKNEVSEMAKNFNLLVRKLKKEFWIKDGINILNNELSGNISLQELSQKALNYIVRYTDGCKGTLYIYDHNTKILSLFSSFAFTERNKLSNKYELGEGIVGQVALEKKPILLKNVSRNDELIISGTISEPPLNVYCLPLIYLEDIYGVIEISSFELFDNYKQDFINESAKITATHLFSAIQGEKIRTLLEISERAKEAALELKLDAQTKASDLLNANEKLEEQQLMLQKQSLEFQQMNAQLEEQQHLLKKQTEELRVKNERLIHSKETLDKKADELELANKYKSEFLANMSHELRTPLNSIILLSKILVNNDSGNLSEKELKSLSIINTSGNELLRLINDILDLSKIEAGKVSPEFSEFYPSEFYDEFKNMFEHYAREKNLDFQIVVDYTGKIVSDKNRISQVIRNFLSNAFKFTEKGSIILKIFRDNDNIVFSVKDTGIGIQEEKKSSIFEAFIQADGSISRKYGGTGLGLSISLEIAKLLNGKITLDSIPGKGSNFSLIIPVIIPEYDSNKKEERNNDNIDTEKKYQSNKDIKILLVEDNEIELDFLKEITRSFDFTEIVANSIESAKKAIDTDNILMAVIDLGLINDEDGSEICRYIKTKHPEIKIIIFTARTLSTIEEKELRKYTDSLVIKSGSYDLRLIDVIKHYLDNYEKDIIKSKTDIKETLFKDKKILIIDDDIKNIFVLSSALEDYGAEIMEATNGKEALEFLNNFSPDLIFTDIMMPVTDGFEFIKKMKENDVLKSIPIIAITAKALKYDKEKILASGADDYISKPVDYEILIKTTKLWLNRS